MDEIKKWIISLLNSTKFYTEIKNRWFDNNILKVYLRISYRSNISKSKMLDLAACEVAPEHRGKGYFTKFLNDLEEICTNLNLPIYVENVLSKRFQNFFEKKAGYKKITSLYSEDICFLKT